MSNFTAIATQTVESTRYVGLEHGTKRITLTIGDTGKQLGPLADHELTPAEARELAASLLARADDIDPDGSPPVDPARLALGPPNDWERKRAERRDRDLKIARDPNGAESRRRLADLIARLDRLAKGKPADDYNRGHYGGFEAAQATCAEAVDLLSNFETLVRYCHSPADARDRLGALHSLARGEGSDSK